MQNTSNETSKNDTADASKESAACGPPTPVDDLAQRIKLLRENGCRAYKDGQLEMVFEAKPRTTLTLSEMALADRAAADAAR